jgi:hypothetical protein
VLVAGMVLGACRDDGGSADGTPEDRGPNRAPPATLAGGVELAAVDPLRLLVGEGLAYGTPLPSEQAAADVYREDPEVASVIARRVHDRGDGHFMARAMVLELDGAELFDESVLSAFVAGAVAALGDGTTEPITLADLPVLRSRGDGGTVLGHREGNQLLIMHGRSDPDVTSAMERSLRSHRAGEVGALQPFTPLVPRPLDAAFVPVPTVAFQPMPPREDEIPPEPPGFPGATAVQGRYGVVAGERRTTIWAFGLDRGTYRSAESLEPRLGEVVATVAGGSPVEASEVLGRVVLRADGSEDHPSVRAFRHHGLALIVEGTDPAQLDAVITAWLKELA